MKLVTALEMNVRQLLNRHSKLRHHKLGIVYEANKAHNSYTISHKAACMHILCAYLTVHCLVDIHNKTQSTHSLATHCSLALYACVSDLSVYSSQACLLICLCHQLLSLECKIRRFFMGASPNFYASCQHSTPLPFPPSS